MIGRTRAHKILTVVTFLSVLAAMGCGSYSPVAPSRDDTTPPGVENPLFVRLSSISKDSVRPMLGLMDPQMISAKDGGTISNGYFSLYFPPGALEEDTEISIDMPYYPLAVVRCSPHGIKFNKAVILSLPLDVIESDASDFRVLWHNDDTDLWEDIGGYIEDDVIIVSLMHFSEYGHEPKPEVGP
jgi:hypothetical protein